MASPSRGRSSARTLDGPRAAVSSREASGSIRTISRGRLRAWLLFAGATSLAFGYAVTGCGNDFDALFPSESSGTTPSGTEAGVLEPDVEGGTGTGESDAGDDGGGVLCAPPADNCVNEPNKKRGDEVASTCSGCQCSCSFACEPKDGRKCSTTCSGGATCNTTCKSDECELEAVGSVADLTCTNDKRGSSCELTCEQGSRCNLKCGRGSCSATCAADSECVVQCPLNDAGNPDRCEVTCEGGERQDCPRGIKTCNRACPP